MTHLHVHSYYSLLDGYSSPEALVVRAKVLGQTALALTDHGNMHGIFKFHVACKAHDIKPILGCEFYIVRGLTAMREEKQKKKNHLTVLARNRKGYEALVSLSTKSFLDGHYYRPTIDISLLSKYAGENLIVLSGCRAGETSRLLGEGNFEEARRVALSLKEMFPFFYLEIIPICTKDDGIYCERNLALGKQLNISCVCTNDVHYSLPGDVERQAVLTKVATGGKLEFESKDLWLKSTEEMKDTLKGYGLDEDTIFSLAGKTNWIANEVEEYGIV